MRTPLLVLACSTVLVVAAACSRDATGIKLHAPTNGSVVVTPQGTLDDNILLVLALLPKGLETAATTRWANIKSKYAAGLSDPSQMLVAKQMLFELSAWVKMKAPNMDPPPAGETRTAASARAVLYMSLYVFNGPEFPPPIFTTTADAVIGLVTPGAPATIVTPSTHAGVALEAGSVAENTIVVISQNPTAYLANCSGPLLTQLCQYPQFYTFDEFPHKTLLKGAKFSVCHVNFGDLRNPPAGIHNRFRLAHTKPASPADYTPGSTVRDQPGESIEILPLISETFTNCDQNAYVPDVPQIGALKGMARRMLAFMSPKTAYAIDQGGGGLSRSFSDFNVVDPSIPELGMLPGDMSSWGLAMNDAGHAEGISGDGRIVGLSWAANYHAVLWQNGQVVSLGTLRDDFGEAKGINPSSQIVGQSKNAAGKTHATIWQPPASP